MTQRDGARTMEQSEVVLVSWLNLKVVEKTGKLIGASETGLGQFAVRDRRNAANKEGRPTTASWRTVPARALQSVTKKPAAANTTSALGVNMRQRVAAPNNGTPRSIARKQWVLRLRAAATAVEFSL